ncbi:MAG TPA: glycosyltransferase family 4 protein [Thermoanaerobaculia bacterium]|nr:glycosyltransferase family 4 protein [Thermoanaerobaculia bacterium]
MTADTVGGVWGYSLELARALAPHGVEFTIATMGEPVSADQHAEAAALDNVRLAESHFRLEWMDEPWQDVDRAGDWLLALASDTSPDLVHLNGYAHAALPWSVPRLVVAHSCVFSWWLAVHGEPPPPQWSTYFERVRAGLVAADLLVAPSWAMLDAIRSIYGSGLHGRVIHNSRNGGYRAGTKEPFILSAGRLWDEAKNVALLTRVAPSLSWPVRVAGDPKERDVPNVESLGRLTSAQLAEQYAHASIYCLPARYEPFGLTILEAALSRCALVLGDIASLREMWDGAAVFVSPSDEGALRAALEELIADQPRRAALAEAAARRADMFAPQTLARRYLAAYQELAQEVFA